MNAIQGLSALQGETVSVLAPVVEFVAYRPEHLKALALQPNQTVLAPALATPGYAEALAQGGVTETAFDAGGRVLAIAGLLPHHDGHKAIAWALLADGLGGRALLAITRRARRGLAEGRTRFDRIEAYVAPGWPNAILWAHRLGFRRWGPPIANFWPGGRAALMFEMVRDPDPAPETAPQTEGEA